MIVRKHVQSFLVAVLLLGITACAPKPEQDIVGRWQLVEQEGNMTIEFRADGTYHATTEAGAMDGMWTLIDNSHIATWSDERKPKRENEFRFENDELIVVEPGGIAHKHVRME